MRPENARMQQWLAAQGLPGVRVKYIKDGSLGGSWRLYRPESSWNQVISGKLTDLGFTGFDGKPLNPFSGNGGIFSVFARGHNELLEG